MRESSAQCSFTAGWYVHNDSKATDEPFRRVSNVVEVGLHSETEDEVHPKHAEDYEGHEDGCSIQNASGAS